MKKILIVCLALLAASPAFARYQRGYFRRNGTYVAPHFKTSSNRTRWDNYSTRGNVNPYTGKKGYTSPYKF